MLKKEIGNFLNDIGYDIPRVDNYPSTELKQKEVYLHKYDENSILLAPLSCLHIGSRYLNKQFLKQCIDFILETDNCYTVFLGDQIENATRTSIGAGIFEEDMHIDDQLEYLSRLLEPLAKANKIWGIHDGNHEFRSTAALGFRPMKMVAKSLGVPYLGYQGYHLLKVREYNYCIFTGHNKSGARTKHSKMKAAERPSEVADCDIYITGHLHDTTFHSKDFFKIDKEILTMKPVTKYFAQCGSFLSYWGSYAEKDIMPPSLSRMLVVSFSGEEFHISSVQKVDCDK